MKRIFERLRRWLIKKLGGYTEQFAPVQRGIMRTADVPVQKLQAQISVAMPGPDSIVDFKQYCEYSVMERLMQELYQSGFILWERQDDVIERKVNLRATLRVANANDLRPHFQCRVE